MTVAELRFYKYALPLTRPLVLKGNELRVREGLLVRCTDGTGNFGWGEIAPLPGFSRETLESVMDEIPAVVRSLYSAEIPNEVMSLEGAFEVWLGGITRTASLRFGIESAVLCLLASVRNESTAHLLTGDSARSIEVNALLSGTSAEISESLDDLLARGFSTFKLKVGSRRLEDDIALVAMVRERIGHNHKLRLDANRQLDVETAMHLLERIIPYNIEYIEEPVRNLNQLRIVLMDRRRQVPVALDESLLELQPGDLALPFKVAAVVLKPSLLGLERSVLFARQAIHNDIVPVISSSFESSVGLAMLAVLAGSIDAEHRAAAGLDTLSWLADDTVEKPLSVNGNSISLDSLDDIQRHVKLASLEEVTLAAD